ncbi:MAG: hypothetical protein AAB855_04970, partial [Patescibacteria group bacterium]
ANSTAYADLAIGQLYQSGDTAYFGGKVGIGTTSLSEKLNIYDGSLTINGTGNQGWQGKVKSWGALAFYPDTDKSGDDDIHFYNNEPKEIMNIDKNGYVHLLSGSNPIRFSPGWTGFPDGTTNQAEISNDTGNYKTLMIVGNRAGNGSTRKVSVWDRLEVNGSLGVSGDFTAGNISVDSFSSWKTKSTKDGYPRWQSRYGCGTAATAPWAKILSMSNGTNPANIYWEGINFKGKMVVHNGNFGQNAPSEFPFDGSIYFSHRDTTPGREKGVVVDRPELRLSVGTPDIIRLVKLGTNNYELQVQQHSDWQCLEYEIQVVNALFHDGGTYSYHDRTASGSDTTVAATYTYPTYTGSVVANNVGTYNGSDSLRFTTVNDSNYSEIAWGDDVATDRLRFFFDHWNGSDNDKEVMTLLGNGSVGIGTSSPGSSYKLDVAGAVNTTGIYVSGTRKDTVWDAKEPAISKGATTHYWRGDKTWQTLNTAAVPESG